MNSEIPCLQKNSLFSKAGDIPANTKQNVDVADAKSIPDVHTLQSYSVFRARIPAKHPNENNSLEVYPEPSVPPPNATPEILAPEPGALEIGEVRTGDQVRIAGRFFDADLDDLHSATVDWGDGRVESLPVIQETGGGLFHGGHVYADGGI